MPPTTASAFAIMQGSTVSLAVEFSPCLYAVPVEDLGRHAVDHRLRYYCFVAKDEAGTQFYSF